MAISYPASIDALSNPASGDPQNSPAHSTQHINANDILEALMAKVGANSSAVTSSIDYLMKALPEGTMINGKIVVSVASNDLTVAIKGMDGNDPSSTNSVYVKIGGIVHVITSALSFTSVDGTNYCLLGSTELAAKENDIFVYLVAMSSSSTTLVASRYPLFTLGTQFAWGLTSWNGVVGYSSGTDLTQAVPVVNIGRFAATLSAGAGYTWTVPTFTSTNLIQRPIFETRPFDYQPVYSGSASMTFTSVATTYAKCQLIGNIQKIDLRFLGSTGGTASYAIIATTPFPCSSVYQGGALCARTNGADITGHWVVEDTTHFGVRRYDGANWASAANTGISQGSVLISVL
jgi:hypothetical protein